MEFYAIQDPQIQSKKILTPVELETVILRKHPIATGEFIFLEWPKLTEDVLVTNGRTAFIAPQTCKRVFFLSFSFDLIFFYGQLQ